MLNKKWFITRTHAYVKGFWGPTATKGPLRVLGLDFGQPRCPLAPVTDKQMEGFKKDLEASGFFDWGTK